MCGSAHYSGMLQFFGRSVRYCRESPISHMVEWVSTSMEIRACVLHGGFSLGQTVVGVGNKSALKEQSSRNRLTVLRPMTLV